jgi:ABC-type lipoprotein release transport system permease subunit
LLAAIGLYGVMAYTVAEQTREIGIRVALGATRSRIARAIVMGGAAVAVFGAAVGMATAAWGTKLIQYQLFGVERSDAVSFIAPIVVLLGAAAVACIVPTRRALSVDPMTAIRAE